MKYINSFNNYKVNEALGIAEATLFYIDVMKTVVLEEILDYIDSHPNLDDKKKEDILIPYSKIRRFITNWKVYKYFPLSEIVIDLQMVRKNTHDVKTRELDTNREISEVETPFKLGGYASSFAKGREKAASRIKDPIRVNMDRTISIHMGIDFVYSSNFKMERHEKKLELKIESVILHELNHIYEHYNRKMKGEPEIEYTTTWTSIGENRRRRPKVLFDYWQNNFTDYIYMSEPHEIRAIVQEAKAYVDRLDFNAFKNTVLWKTAKKMESFDTDQFKKQFNREIHKYNPQYVDKIIDVFVNDFKSEYKRLSLEYKEKNSVKPEFLEKLDTDQFFKFWGDKIRKAGQSTIRKMARLYAYKKQEEEELY